MRETPLLRLKGRRPRLDLVNHGLMPLAVVAFSNAAMGLTVLDFEDIAAPATITAQYGPRGVLFRQAHLGIDAAARSGTRVLRTSPPNAEIFTPIPLIMDFTSAQARVKLFAGSPNVALNGTLRAFDANNTVVASDGPKLVAANVFTTQFEVTTATAVIVRAELQLEGSAHQAIDDLEFDGEPPAPTPTQPPVVQITSPANGGDVDITTLDIAGTVTGEGLLPLVNVTISYLQPPTSTAPPINLDLTLTGTGTTRQFSFQGFTNVPIGPVTVTATAENTGGLKGTGTSTFTNLPAGIRGRVTPAMGAFRFGLSPGNCKVAVYESAAVSDTKFVIIGEILTKWLSLLTPTDQVGLGCPKGDERGGPSGSRVQDFDKGRIYSTGGIGTFQVPAVFVDAIDKRGGEAGTGVPIADPTSSIGVMQTWLFQQFTRPERPDLLPSTLEIRGTPPVLSIERQGGDLSSPFAYSATRWEEFACTGSLGPCAVEPEPPFPPENISNAGALFCDSTTYWPGHIGGPPEWVPVPSVNGHYDAIPVFGVIRSSFMADIDNVFTHETYNGNCPYFPDTIFGATLPIGAVAPTCASDFEFKLRPIGPQPGSFPRPSFFGQSNLDLIKVEYEVFYAATAQNFFDPPTAGDLVHMTGRWIIDCGHSTYKSEIHPLFSYAKMKTLNQERNFFTGIVEPLSFLTQGQLATRADVWVNGWYPGLNPIEFDIFPPPRPSPDAILHIVKPPDGEAIRGDLSLEFRLAPAGAASHVHLKFTAPFRPNEVTDAGEMKWEYGRRYIGKWYAFWTQ